MKMSDKLCSTDAVPLGKEPQVLTEKQADGVKCVRDLRSLHWGLAKVCDTRIPVLYTGKIWFCWGALNRWLCNMFAY